MKWYDDIDAMRARIDEHGLLGLTALSDERAKAHYERDEDLDTFIVLGRFYFDRCGNTGVLDAPLRMGGRVPVVVSREQLKSMFGEQASRVSIRLSGPIFARPEHLCDRCGDAWSLDDAHDIAEDSKTPRHRECHKLAVIGESMAWIRDVLGRAEIPTMSHYMIPNRYWPSGSHDAPPPWHVLETTLGSVLVGWRKSVIVVDWSRSQITANGRDIVAHPKTTFAEHMVHCWGVDECVAALVKLREHVERNGGWT